jgi:hypothetical protein
MTDNLNPPEIKVASRDDILLVTCPRCHTRTPVQVREVVRGLDYICEKCGIHVESHAKSPRPWGVIEMRRGDDRHLIKAMQRLDGIWVFLDEGEQSILAALDNDSERAIAILIGSMIENRLERAMLARFCREKKIERRVFSPAGALGTFGAKIDLAFLIGLVSPEGHKNLSILKDIRNLFAHDLDIRDFRSQQIKDKTANFDLIDSYVAEAVVAPDGKQTMVTLDPSAKPAIFTKHAAMRLKQAKDRYLLTAQLLTLKFALCEYPAVEWPLI